LKRERELLQIDVGSLQMEGDQLQDLGWLQKEVNEQLARQLKNAKMALGLEEGIQKSLAVAAEAAKMILATDKVELIQKDLDNLYKREPLCNPKGVHVIQDRLECFCLVKD
jgi:hypothetical protein